MAAGAKEKRFLKALGDLFTGAEVEGDSGFVNLMSMKRAYFRSISPKLMERIDKRAPKKDAAPREELFDKLHTFFKRYFCESGSIYFRRLPAFAKTYERVYQDGQDAALSWKTRMLYYVKSDVLVRSMPVVLDSGDRGGGGGSLTTSNARKFYFDASGVEHKRSNEKRDFVFAFDRVRDEREGRVVHLTVAYSEKGRKTNVGDILKYARKADVPLTEDQLEQAIGVFRRQTEADYFIHKDARGFLREQFDLWMHQYLFHEETIFDQERLRQLQALRDTAYDVIDFIAQFEDELRRAWEKPKFVRRVNYVATLDRLDADLLRRLSKHKGAAAQVEEWQKFEMVDKAFTMSAILNGRKGLTPKYRFLPLDTRYFKDLELEILDGLGNLDEALDGELVHSENWQALNTLRKRYQGKVQCIYIDPPFNLDGSDQFDYRTNYKDSSWATMLENRIALVRNVLSYDGAIFVRCDYNGNWIVRCLMDNLFGDGNFKNEVALARGDTPKGEFNKMETGYDTMLFYACNSENCAFKTPKVKRDNRAWQEMHLPTERSRDDLRYRVFEGRRIYPPKGRHWALNQKTIDKRMREGAIRTF